jgi:hypothetical protein
MSDAEKAEIEKDRAFGLKQLEKSGSSIINAAKSYWDELSDQVKSSDEAKVRMDTFSSKVEETINKLPKKQTIELGEYEGQKLGQLEVVVADDVAAEIKKLLSPDGIKQNLLTADGTFNVDFLAKHLANSLSYERAVKHSYLTAQTNTIKNFQATFGSKPPVLGAQPRTEKGQITSAGSPVVHQRQSK